MGHVPALQTTVQWDGTAATVTVTGELNITTAADLTRNLRAVAAKQPERLTLDLGGLVFTDVAGARALDAAHVLLQTRCPVKFWQPRPSARKALARTGLTEG